MKTTFRPQPLALAVAGLASLAAPGARTAAAADLKLEMSLGVASVHLDQPSAHFGQYHGITRSKDTVFGNLKLSYKPGSDYVEATGNNLGMDNQDVTLSAGRYGSYGLVLGQDKFASPIAVDAQTPFDGVGSDRLTLSGFNRGTTTSPTAIPPASAMSNLASKLKSTDLGLDRTTERAGLFFTPTDRWRFEIGAEQYSVQGKKPLGGMMRFSVSTILPAPVDEKTSIFGAALNYRGDRTQWSAGYRLSKYDNHFNSLTFDNPFTGPPATMTAATQGRLSLAPDNLQHTLNVTGAVNNLPLASRLTLNVEHSRAEQDERFLPYSYNPALVTTPLPRDSAKIQVDTTQVTLDLASRPLANLKTNLRYRFRERDTDIPRASFQRVVNDTENQAAIADALTQRSLPDHMSSHQLKLDGSYSLGRTGTVKAGIRRDIEERDDRAIQKSREDAIFGGFSRRFGDRAGLDVRLEHAKKKAIGGYDQLRVFELMHTPEYLRTPPAASFHSHPLARQYDIADRSRDKLGLSYTLQATTNLNVGLHAHYTHDAYSDGQFGLKSLTNKTYTLDADYSLPEDYSLFAYATEEHIDYTIKGRQFGSVPDPLLNYGDARYDWTMVNNDQIFTLGLGGTKWALDDKLRLKLAWSRSISHNDIRFTAGSKLSYLDLPAGRHTRDRVELRGDYEFMPRTTLGLGAIHDRHRMSNWAQDGIPAGSSAITQVLTLVEPMSGYRAYTLYGQLGHRW